VLLNISTVMNTFWCPQSNDLVHHSIQYFCMLSSILQANLLRNGFGRITLYKTEDSKRSLLSTPTTTLPLLIGNETINKTDCIIIMMIYSSSITAPSLQSGFTWRTISPDFFINQQADFISRKCVGFVQNFESINCALTLVYEGVIINSIPRTLQCTTNVCVCV
jgi:hypothetical protein